MSAGDGTLGQRFRDEEIIYRQGEPGDRMYVIQKGVVEVLQRSGDKEFCLAELGAGDFFGESALFDGRLRSTTVRAAGDVWVYTLQRDTLLRRFHEDPSLAFQLIQQLSARVKELRGSLVREADVPLASRLVPSGGSAHGKPRAHRRCAATRKPGQVRSEPS